ncbi:DUF6196 family protein [Nocardioides vastitatis]|uniref:DUF6196 family protein n=1 Tax=Nocardioides vastitatis TaxID=2568655 RepID=A0ABW0ZQY6_9ACTN
MHTATPPTSLLRGGEGRIHLDLDEPAGEAGSRSRGRSGKTFDVLPGQRSYHEHPAGAVPQPSADALALVRDEDCWSILEPSRGGEAEGLGAFSIHFPTADDNSGCLGSGDAIPRVPSTDWS